MHAAVIAAREGPLEAPDRVALVVQLETAAPVGFVVLGAAGDRAVSVTKSANRGTLRLPRCSGRVGCGDHAALMVS